MRPLLLANYDFVVGGGEVGLALLIDALMERGHQPLVAVPGRVPLFGGCDERSIPVPIPARALAIRELARACDLVHAFSTRSALTSVLAKTSKPLLMHALIPNPDPYDLVILPFVDALVCNSRATAARFGPASTRVIYNGIPPPRPTSSRLDVRPGQRTIAIVGTLGRRKGQLDALPALEQVMSARDDVDVVFAGHAVPGPVALELRERAAAWNGRLRLLGFVPDISDHFAEFALVVVPSRSEGFGRVAVESLRAGVPVLATRVEGLMEALGDLRDPWLPESRDSWADRILRELDTPTHTRAELMAAATPFDQQRHTDEILSCYHRLIQSNDRVVHDAARQP